MTPPGRAARERAFHDHRYADDPRAVNAKYYDASAGRRRFAERLQALARGKRVLECGCGPGQRSHRVGDVAASVVGVDISAVAIRTAARRARTAAHFVVGDIERLPFPDRSFDVVCGAGILHHVAMPLALDEVARLLAPDGVALFLEPLAHNPLVALYRRLTPSQRSADERPLRLRELDAVHTRFTDVKVRPFDFLTLATAVIRPARRIGTQLERADVSLFSSSRAAWRLAWVVLIELRRPRAPGVETLR